MFGLDSDSQKALDSLVKGEKIETGGNFGNAVDETVNSTDSVPFEEMTQESDMNVDSSEPNSEVTETTEASDENAGNEEVSIDSKEEEQTTSEDIEWVKADGKKIKIDYSDRERIKKVHQMAAGARKWQSERDSAIKERDDYKTKYEENQRFIDACDEVIDDDDALFRLITGGRNLDEIVQKRIEEQSKLSEMSPDQLDAYKKSQDLEKRERELQKREEALKLRDEEANQKLDTSEKQRQQAMLNAAFNEHRFAGKIGDKRQETRVDKMLWRDIIDRLGEYDSINQEIVNKVVKEAAGDLKSIIRTQKEKETKTKIIEQKKTSQTKAQDAVFDKDQKKVDSVKAKVEKDELTSTLAGFLGGDFSFFK